MVSHGGDLNIDPAIGAFDLGQKAHIHAGSHAGHGNLTGSMIPDGTRNVREWLDHWTDQRRDRSQTGEKLN